MKTKIILFLGLMLTANVSFADLKIGFVNIPAVLEKAPQAEKAKKRLELEFSPRDKQLLSQQKEIQTKEEKMARDGAVMGESERSNLEKDILNKKRDAKRSQQEFSEDFNARRNEEMTRLQRVLIEEVQTYAKAQSFDLVLADGVMYFNNSMDITAAILSALQVRRGPAAAAPAKPAAPKPAPWAFPWERPTSKCKGSCSSTR